MDTPIMPIESFQAGVSVWLVDCFGADIAMNSDERSHRFLEEALELVQSKGCTASEAHQFVEYVFSRTVGEPAQEVGGVMVTLAALCCAADIDMAAAADDELRRIWTKIPEIRAKQERKPKHFALPAGGNHTDDQSPSYEALAIIVNNLCGALEAHGLADDFDSPADAINELVRRAASSASNKQTVIGFDKTDGVDTTVYSHVDDKGVVHIDQIEQAADRWQTIRTAPLDGSVIMLRRSHDMDAPESLAWYIADRDSPTGLWAFLEHDTKPGGCRWRLSHSEGARSTGYLWRPFRHDTFALLEAARAVGLREMMHGVRATEAKQALAAFVYILDQETPHG